MKTIKHGNEFWKLHDDGAIERPGLVAPDASTWRVVGAVRYNDFGHEVDRVSLHDLLHGEPLAWKHKNGKQNWRIIDMDHGTRRVWGADHSIY